MKRTTQRIIKREDLTSWHDLFNVIQCGPQQQPMSAEQIDALIIIVCEELDAIRAGISENFYSSVLGLLSEFVIQSGRRNNPLAEVKNIKDGSLH